MQYFCGEAISILNLRKSHVWNAYYCPLFFPIFLIFRSTDDERHKGAEGGMEAGTEAEMKQ